MHLIAGTPKKLGDLRYILERHRIESPAKAVHLPGPVVFGRFQEHIAPSAIARPPRPHLDEDLRDVCSGYPSFLKESQHQLIIGGYGKAAIEHAAGLVYFFLH